MQHQAFEQFAVSVTERLRAESRVVALIALGSFADEALRHSGSDHDFWVVTEPGAQSAFRESASWLPEAASQLITVCFPNRGASVLYRNRHLVEYAVFSRDELTRQVTDRYRVIFDRAGVTADLPTLLAKTTERGVSRWRGPMPRLTSRFW